MNPFRYRGYYYDTETGLYYLQSRYYDPEIGRFINADGLVSTGQGVLGNNMFAYCENNWVNFSDPSGLCKKQGNLYVRCDVKGCMFAPLSTPKEMIITKPAVKPTPVQKVSKPATKYNKNNIIINKPNSLITGISVGISNETKNITIFDSYKITSEAERMEILTTIMLSPEFDHKIHTRSFSSYLSEWNGHNALYNTFVDIEGLDGKIAGRLKNVDLNDDNWIPWDWVW